ncbi:LysR substrate-binding domain-containing protein [Pseudomonas sp. RIT-PI-AD]|uniref:LysR substrate-binding domain-containing protein n=1 Tax=Pseudomonas sp. RIT-PI-AD TaxID=3035294 RepID=UPI0021DB36F8|nr:LysR substrate-binding domain-containing protein [Pseudomonas sp. RIT-PI-AD]
MTINLRQVEAFRAVIESGTVSAAATALYVTQPAVSKLLAQLEHQTGLHLFERTKGRLAPTPQGMRLYQEVDRIFAGLHQLASAVEVVKREEGGHLIVGVLPALSGAFTREVIAGFREIHPEVFVSVKVRASVVLADWLATRQIDVGLLNTNIDHPDLELQPLLRQPLICLLPLGHPLVRKRSISIKQLKDEPFIAFDNSVEMRRITDDAFAQHGLTPRYILEANTAPSVCEFVAAGMGVSIMHPAMAGTAVGRVAIRQLTPIIDDHFLLGRMRTSRNARYVEDFIQAAHAIASRSKRDIQEG